MYTVALLDVDHTLLFDLSDSLNLTLLNCLLEHEITRIYLFTDMTFSRHTIEERNGLMKQLEELGFSVQGAITPNDIAWANMNTSEVTKLHDMCFRDRTYSGKLYGAEFEAFVLEQSCALPTLSKAVQCYIPSVALPSESYSEACLELHSTGTICDATKMKSIFAKVLADHLSEKCGYKHNKGLLLDMFLRHRPDWVSSVIAFDDNSQVIEDIGDFKLTKVVDDDAGRSSASIDASLEVPVPISVVPVTSSTHSAEYYNQLILKHLHSIV